MCSAQTNKNNNKHKQTNKCKHTKNEEQLTIQNKNTTTNKTKIIIHKIAHIKTNTK